MRLEIHKQTHCRLPRQKLNKLFRTVHRREGWVLRSGKINLIFTDNNFIRRLNRRYRRKNKATDVLSFNVDEPGDKNSIVGEIYISVPTARLQAREYEIDIQTEFLRLFCHGLLHLLGYDHLKPGESRRMMALQEKYLKAAGVRV